MDSVARCLAEAAAASEHDATRVALATATSDGRPSVRYVLAKDVDVRGVSFFTRYTSRKGRELDANPLAALAFHWWETGVQARLEGHVVRLDPAESDAYFASRPRGSQIGAWASPQSEVIPNRAFLETRVREIGERFGEEVPRPEQWGGYRLVPDRVELWRDRPSRLHDRVLFVRASNGTWSAESLAP